jgi:endonuclease/exonuclease/phosphatase family metal-dependent hydrolase
MTSTRTTRAVAPVLLAALALAAACATTHPPMIAMPGAPAAAACRAPVAPDGARTTEAIVWTVASRARDTLDAWCGTTGPPVIAPEPAPLWDGPDDLDGSTHVDELVIVSWNVHVGSADVVELVRRLRAGVLTGGPPVEHFVLLLQEAYRADPIVPRLVSAAVRPPKAIRSHEDGRQRVDIVEVAQSLGLALYYVPSMRNGGFTETDEDRGNAILSTEPLSDFTAIELPFERQRRVAISASISGRDRDGDAWTLPLASAHLESTVSARRLWILANGARVRQARALLDALRPGAPVVLGGDFNTWFGFSDPAYRTIAAAIDDAARADRRPTFPPFLRLDHLFSRLPDGWRVSAKRLDDTLGSDHYPLLARLQPSAH